MKSYYYSYCKIIEVIDSCVTKEQLETTNKMVWNYYNLYASKKAILEDSVDKLLNATEYYLELTRNLLNKYKKMNSKKELYILRGVSGSGRSTLAETLNGVICCADDYLTDSEGNYKWSPGKINLAHNWCQDKAKQAMISGEERVIISNTNTYKKDVELYRNMGLDYGYKVFVLVVENYHNGQNIHNVPEETLLRQENNIKSTLKLR